MQHVGVGYCFWRRGQPCEPPGDPALSFSEDLKLSSVVCASPFQPCHSLTSSLSLPEAQLSAQRPLILRAWEEKSWSADVLCLITIFSPWTRLSGVQRSLSPRSHGTYFGPSSLHVKSLRLGRKSSKKVILERVAEPVCPSPSLFDWFWFWNSFIRIFFFFWDMTVTLQPKLALNLPSI